MELNKPDNPKMRCLLSKSKIIWSHQEGKCPMTPDQNVNGYFPFLKKIELHVEEQNKKNIG
jgi:hypothetical protein